VWVRVCAAGVLRASDSILFLLYRECASAASANGDCHWVRECDGCGSLTSSTTTTHPSAGLTPQLSGV